MKETDGDGAGTPEEQRLREVLDGVGVSVWEEDFTEVARMLDGLRGRAIDDLEAYLASDPAFVDEAIRRVRIIDVNGATLRMFGASDKSELLASLGSIFVAETRGVFIGELLALARGDRWFAAETRLRSLRGAPVDVLFTVSFPPGRPDRVVVTLTDITARRAAEQAVKESEHRFRNMADHAPVMIWVTDAAGRCTYLNARWYDFTGQDPGAALGDGWLDAVHPDDVPRTQQAFLHAAGAGTKVALEYRLRRRDGAYRWMLDAATPRVDAVGAVVGYIGSVIDIDDRKEAERERQRLIDELAAAVHARDEFLAVAAHELRTPLTPLQLTLDGVHRHLDGGTGLPPAALRERVERAVTQAARLGGLVDTLLDVSRVLHDRVALDRREVDITEAVGSIVSRFSESARQQGVELRCSAAPAVVVSADPVRIDQVISNLLSNAIKFGERRPVTVEVVATPADVRIRVIDQGRGVADDDLARIFGRFQRAVPTRHFGGLGLGLYIARELVLAHGGDIVAESEPGRGSTFTVVLPR